MTTEMHVRSASGCGPPAAATARLPYTPPTLTTFGTLAAVTARNGGTLGMNDGAAGNDKTGF